MLLALGLIATIAILGRIIFPKIQPSSGETLQTFKSQTCQIIEGNSLIATRNSNLFLKTSVLAVISESPMSNKIEEEKLVLASILGKNTDLTQDEIQKILEICFCESSFNQKAVSYAGWKAGMGECGFIPKTWNYTLKLYSIDKSFMIPSNCLEKFIGYDKIHPIFNKECNLLMAAFLFRKEGDGHWYSSKKCWNKN